MKAKMNIAMVSMLVFSGIAGATLDWNIYDGTNQIQNSQEYGIVNVFNGATLDVMGGSAEYIFGNNNSVISVSGGEVDVLEGHNSSAFHLSGGKIGTISIDDSSHFTIYGSDFIWLRAGGGAESGWLSGNWFGGPSFNIYFRDLPEPFPGSHITLIPEPTSFLFILTGSVLLRLRKR